MWDQIDRLDPDNFYFYNDGETSVYVYASDHTEETRIEWDGGTKAELWENGECFAMVPIRQQPEDAWDEAVFRSVEEWKRERHRSQHVGTEAQPAPSA